MRCLLCFLAIMSTQAAGCRANCDLSAHIRGVAGKDARNCGDFGMSEPRDEGHACTVDAFRRKQSFVMTVRVQHIEGIGTGALVAREARDVRFLTLSPGNEGEDDTVWETTCRGPMVVSGADTADFAGQVGAGAEVITCENQDHPDTHRVCP